jgi:AraC family transcriptional regulator, positive regulator of tynA and feaB
MMHPGGDFLNTPELNYEDWRDALRPQWGWYNPEAIEHKAFAGRARARSVCGFVGIDISCNAPRVERTQRDVRLDDMEHYYAVFQVAGKSTIIQNNQTVNLAVGDATLIDSAQPVTYFNDDGYGQFFSLQLPRRSLVSHLGFEPQYGSYGGGKTRAGRLLFRLVLDAVEDENSGSELGNAYMPLAVYDLLGAQFAPSDSMPIYSEKVFRRVCNIIKDRFSDPELGPKEVAAEAGISLRYLQKLFTARNSTCNQFIHSLRLDHAARLLHRRDLRHTKQPISEIAYASGYGDYTNFARKFRRRFGLAPAAHAKNHY